MLLNLRQKNLSTILFLQISTLHRDHPKIILYYIIFLALEIISILHICMVSGAY